METLIVEPKSRKQLNAIKAVLKALDVTFRQEQESPYNPEFVERIRKSEQQFEEGKVTRVTKENIQSFLGLE
jgi:NH3-dependent NAD+ synthetase